jgi:predicted nucleic acid-binding protein
MGPQRTELAVADAGPLIHLNEIARLSVLAVFHRLYVPVTVWAETVSAGRVPAPALQLLPIEHKHLDDGDVAMFIDQARLQHMQRGECEGLCLCRQLGVNILLTDDLAGRDAATQMHIRPVGSLGVILRAAQLRMLSVDEAETCLLDLHHVSSLFVTDAIVASAIAILRNAQERPASGT